MAKKKSVKKRSVKRASVKPMKATIIRSQTSNAGSFNRKIGVALRNLILFTVLFLVSFFLYVLSSDPFYVNLFLLSTLLFAFLMVAFMIVVLVFFIMKVMGR